jgi:hypothetical protein
LRRRHCDRNTSFGFAGRQSIRLGANRDDVTDRRLEIRLLGLAGTESSVRRLGAQPQPFALGLVDAASEAAAAKMGTIGPHCAAHHHLSSPIGAGRGLAEPAVADEVSAQSGGRGEERTRIRVQGARLRDLSERRLGAVEAAGAHEVQLASNRRQRVCRRVCYGAIVVRLENFETDEYIYSMSNRSKLDLPS